MRGREINYTFWGEPIDTNWYEWYLAVRTLFEKYGLSPRILLETHNMEAAKRIAARSGAVFLVPGVYVSDSIPDRELMRIYPILNQEFQHHFYVCYRKGRHLTRFETDLVGLVCRALGTDSPLKPEAQTMPDASVS